MENHSFGERILQATNTFLYVNGSDITRLSVKKSRNWQLIYPYYLWMFFTLKWSCLLGMVPLQRIGFLKVCLLLLLKGLSPDEIDVLVQLRPEGSAALERCHVRVLKSVS